MDLSSIFFEKLFGHSSKKAVRFFIVRMWIGYAFDAGEFAFTWIHVGMRWISDTWRYVFYGYVGFVGLVAFLITFGLVCCVLRGGDAGGRLKRHKKIPYFMGYFKLTSAVNAGIVFFNLYYSTKNEEPEVLAIEILTGIDMGVDLLQMGFGLAGLTYQRACAKDSEVMPYQESPTATSSRIENTSRITKKSKR